MASVLCSSFRAVAQAQRLVGVRTVASTASPIHELFISKIREYASKEKSAEHGLVGANSDDLKLLKDEEFNLIRRFGELETSSLGAVASAKMDLKQDDVDGDPLKEFDPFQRMKQDMPKVGETDNFMLAEVNLPEFLRS